MELESFTNQLDAIKSEALVLRLWQSGRELFHSNVLAYLLESGTFGPRLLKYLWEADCAGYHVRALREKNGIDLLILMLPMAENKVLEPSQDCYWQWLAGQLPSGAHARVLAIENKFKSLPDPAQLQGYSEVLHNETDVMARKMSWFSDSFQEGEERVTPPENAAQPYLRSDLRKVILTPGCGKDIDVKIPVTYTLPNGKNQRKKLQAEQLMTDTWSAKDWQTIAGLLTQGELECDLEAQFIGSYARSLAAAGRLLAELKTWCEGAEPFAKLDLLRPRVQALRLQDFFDKWRYEFLTRRVRTALEQAGWEDLFVRSKRGVETQFRPTLADEAGTAVVCTFYSRGTGGTDIALFRGTDAQFAVELQLQGTNLKLMFAFEGTCHDESQRREAMRCALDRIVQLDGKLGQLFACVPKREKPHQYKQMVGIRTSGPSETPLAVEVERVDGYLLYAKIDAWTFKDQLVTGPWAQLPCAAVAKELADSAIELAHAWEGIAEAMSTHLGVRP